MSNSDLGIGTKKRYSARGMGMYSKDALRLQVMGSANNTGETKGLAVVAAVRVVATTA